MPRIALVSVHAARVLDEDLAPLTSALHGLGAQVDVVDWDAADIDWARFDLAVLRSTWDYTQRVAEFLAWAEHAAAQTRLLNPLEVVRWNIDKHYLGELARAGVAIVPSTFVEADADARAAVTTFLASEAAHVAEFVVKPCIGAGSRDAQRYARAEVDAAGTHVARLLAAGRSVLLQPYLDRVDEHGETALIYFDGVFSHAIRKGPLLRRGEGPTRALFASEEICPRTPSAAERALAEHALAAIGKAPAAGRRPQSVSRATGQGGTGREAEGGLRECFDASLPYARVDLIHAADGAPRLLELELAEPSLFFDHAAGSALRFARVLLAHAGALRASAGPLVNH